MHKEDIFIAVGAVIKNDESQILLVKHVPERGGFWKGKWICPGGGLRFGESIEDGIKREIMEETGLEIALTSRLIPFERIVKVNSKTTLHVIYIDYLARLIEGSFKPGSDVGEGLWIHREEIPSIREELHDDTWRLLQIAKVV